MSFDTTGKKTKWYNIHIWFLRGFLIALASSYAKVVEWISWKSKRSSIKLSIFGACMLVSLVFYLKLNIDTHNDHELDSAQSPFFPCRRTPKQAKELRELFYDVHEILNKMNIRHFLIYGSIWGARRTQGPLPWDYDIDLGIIGGERYSEIPKSEFLKPFRERGITVYDQMELSSCFYLTRGDFAQVDIDVFYDYSGLMQRNGLATWFLYYNYRQYHTFPAWMIKAPLPKMKFADLDMPVPHGGKAILKYLYPKDWNKPFTPAACLKENKLSAKTLNNKINQSNS